MYLYRAPDWHPQPLRRSLAPSKTAATPTITTDALQDETGAVLASTTIDKIVATRLSDLVQVCTWTAQTTNGSGVLTLSHASLTAVPHIITTASTSGADAGAKVYTPA